jgi:hypothetical protein
LVRNLPQYENNLRAKIASLPSPVGMGLEKTTETFKKLSQELDLHHLGYAGHIVSHP